MSTGMVNDFGDIIHDEVCSMDASDEIAVIHVDGNLQAEVISLDGGFGIEIDYGNGGPVIILTQRT